MGDHSVHQLPPGFHFNPTDEELILHFLYPKSLLCPPDSLPMLIPDLHLYSLTPWDLNGKAMSSGTHWYFFSPFTENQVTENGFWKKSDVDDEPIFTAAGTKVGTKTHHVFYIGEAPDAMETSWVMHEYRLCSSGFSATSYIGRGKNIKMDCSKWVLCRVYEKKSVYQGAYSYNKGGEDHDDEGIELSCLDEIFFSLDDDDDDDSNHKFFKLIR